MKNHKDKGTCRSAALEEKPKRPSLKEEKLARALRRNLVRRKQAASRDSFPGT